MVLLHGFMMDAGSCWERTGLAPALAAAGRRVVLPDARGHGASARPHDPASYGGRAMARDAVCLLDQLGAERVDLVGYGLGAATGLELAAMDPRVRLVVAGGVGLDELTTEDYRQLARAMRSDDPTKPEIHQSFSPRLAGDREVHAAWLEGAVLPQLDGELLARVEASVLVVNGEGDLLDGEELVARLPRARRAVVPGDHVSARESPELRELVLGFLTRP